MDRGLRKRLEDLLQQREHDQVPVQMDGSAEELLEPDGHFLLVQERRADRKAAPDGGRFFSIERPQSAPSGLRARFDPRARLETQQRDRRAIVHLGEVSQGDGRSLAANPQEKRNRAELAGTDRKNSVRYLAGPAHRRDPRNLQQRERQLARKSQGFARAP